LKGPEERGVTHKAGAADMTSTTDLPSLQPVAVRNVRATFGGPLVLDDVSFAVARGEMFGLIGPDGAGKTTLLRLICGLLKPAGGAVHVLGEDPYRNRAAATRSIGYLSQRFSLYGDLTIDENVEFFARLHGVSDFEPKRARLLALVGLERFRHRLADRLSGGMKQKLALACTLIHEPPVIVLDEPTTGVDPVSRREFWKLLGEFLAEGLTILVATPYLDEAERCSRVVLMSDGRVLALDAPSRLRTSLGGVLFEVVPASPRLARAVLAGTWGEDRVESFGDRLHVQGDRAEDADRIAAVLDAAGQGGAAIRPVMPGLEDVFIELLAAARPGPDRDHETATPQGTDR
jgi:ABC-2 type transport system ATP-binding protein